MRTRIRVVTALAVIAGTLALTVLGATSDADWELEERNFSFGEFGPVDREPLEMPSGGFDASDLPEPGQSQSLSWLRTAGVVAVVALALFIGWRVWLWARRRLADRAPRRPARTTTPVPTDDPEPDVPVLRRGVAEAQRSLRAIGRPVDAVVAAWVALETAAEASGVVRSPAQTPTEFTVAVLRRTPADPAAVRELLSLYHLARFSDRPIGPAQVEAAASCLGVLATAFDDVDVATAGQA